MGVCDTITGNCQCYDGFYGASCQYMSCSGSMAHCNGHRKCVSMQEVAQYASYNGETIDVTYGMNPNNPNTWDGYRIFGCLCDSGYEGYDCSEMTCPRGDDPMTYMDHNEVQILTCDANGGTFFLTFRNESTPPIPYTVTSYQLSKILSQLSTIKNVTVTFNLDGSPPPGTLNKTSIPPLYSYLPSEPGPTQTWNINGTQLCTTSTGQSAIISFDVTPGNLPPLRLNNSYLINTLSSSGYGI
jgi:hypothetical protein